MIFAFMMGRLNRGGVTVRDKYLQLGRGYRDSTPLSSERLILSYCAVADHLHGVPVDDRRLSYCLFQKISGEVKQV